MVHPLVVTNSINIACQKSYAFIPMYINILGLIVFLGMKKPNRKLERRAKKINYCYIAGIVMPDGDGAREVLSIYCQDLFCSVKREIFDTFISWEKNMKLEMIEKITQLF